MEAGSEDRLLCPLSLEWGKQGKLRELLRLKK
jgi:hypothetical protein